MKKTIALQFVEAINSHDIDRIYDLMAEDYVFIDTYAAEVHGRDSMKEGWIGYFAWFPDYCIEVVETMENADAIVLWGFAGATYKGNVTPDKKHYWRLPAAWKVTVDNGKVKLWQVICDSKIPMDLMNAEDRERVPEVNPKLKEDKLQI